MAALNLIGVIYPQDDKGKSYVGWVETDTGLYMTGWIEATTRAALVTKLKAAAKALRADTTKYTPERIVL